MTARGVINGYDLAIALGVPVLRNGGRDAFDGWRPTLDNPLKSSFSRATCGSFESARKAVGIGPDVAAVCLDGREQWWVWIDAAHADAAERLTLDRTGKNPRVMRGVKPCADRFLSTEVCARPAKDGDTLCGLHRGVVRRAEARQAEYQARQAEYQAELDRENAAIERAIAELDARIDVLVEAGIVRATLDVTAGRSGDAVVNAPIESIVALLDEFALAIGLSERRDGV